MNEIKSIYKIVIDKMHFITLYYGHIIAWIVLLPIMLGNIIF